MDVLSEGVIAPLMKKVFVNYCHYSFISGTNRETHPKGIVSLAAA
jgi:hypothetical protein